MKRHGIGPTKASADLGVTKTAVIQWKKGERVPNPVSRQAIEVWTHGEVRADDWVPGKVEREVRERAAEVKPFEPEPEPDSSPVATASHGEVA